MQTLNTLDVTAIEPRLKHPTIFDKFDQLASDEAFIIHNDHDPKPLYYQLIGERGNVFSWDYLQNGPDFWKVKITKNSGSPIEPTLGDMVAKDYRKAQVFKKYGLDFCCGGKKTVSEACDGKDINLTDIKYELDLLDIQEVSTSLDYNKWDLGFLADYIVYTHHDYLKTNIPVLIDYTNKVSRVHGERHPEVMEIAEKFRTLAAELLDHMDKEEIILFPYIKELALHHTNKSVILSLSSIKLQETIKFMEHEHAYVGELLMAIRELSDNYTPPKDACTTYNVSYLKLKEFENDLHQHIHLENNILFPKSVILENNL